MLSVLAHLDAGASYAACVSSLGGTDDNAVLFEVIDRLVGGRHVSRFAQELTAVSNHRLRLVDLDLVLSSAGDVEVSLNAPGLLAGEELRARELVCVRSADVLTGGTQLEEIIDLLAGDAVLVEDVAVGTGDGDRLSAELFELLSGTPSNITEAGDNDLLALEALAEVLEHLTRIEDNAVAGSLVTTCKTAVHGALTGESAVIQVADALILTHHEADFSAAYADVACGNVGLGADMTIELSDEALAEAHDLHVGLAVGIKVGTTLAAADRQTGQAVLEDLLKAEELDDTDIYGRMESQTALVRTDRGVELYTVTDVDLYLTVIVYPRNAELDLSLGLGDALEQSQLAILRFVSVDNGTNGVENLFYGLKEFRLGSVLFFYFCDDFINIRHKIYLLILCLYLIVFPRDIPKEKLHS